MANCEGFPTKNDLITVKQSIDHITHVSKSVDSSGNPALSVTDNIGGDNVTNLTLNGLQQKYFDAISAIGYIPVNSFEAGATLTLPNQALAQVATNTYFIWTGALPKIVPAGSTPASTGGTGPGAWFQVGDGLLRSQLAADDGYKLVPSIFAINSQVPVEMYRSSSLTDQQVIQNANDFAKTLNRSLIFQSNKTYEVDTVSPSTKWIGNGATLKRKNGTGSVLFKMGSNSSIEGFIIDGNRSNSSSVVSTVSLDGVSGASVINNNIINCPEHSIVLKNDVDSTNRKPNIVKNNIVNGALGSGIYLFDSLYSKILDNDVFNCGNGILGQGSKRSFMGTDVIGNSCHNNTGGGIGFVLRSEAEDMQAYEKIKIISNRVYGNGGTGIAAQSDTTIVVDNHVWNNGSETYHQGVLVNANGVIVSNNVITGNAGVGIDFGDCRKCSATSNHIEENGWIGIEVNSCEQVTVTGNVLNLNFKGKADAELQAAILLHKGDGGYPFVGDNTDITVTGNTIRSGDGQRYAILVADINCKNSVITGNTCRLSGLQDDIVTKSPDVIIENNVTRWDPMGTARAQVVSNGISIPSVANTVSVNGSGSVLSINILNNAAFIKDRYVRIYSVNGLTLENSGPSSTGNLFIGSPIVLQAGDSVRLWSDGSGGWKRA